MSREFTQSHWDAAIEADCRAIVRAAIIEDLGDGSDWTTVALVPADAMATADIVSRRAGVIAGLPAAAIALAEIDRRSTLECAVQDGARVAVGQVVCTLAGPARALLTAERTVLNLLGRLSGIATLTNQYVEAIGGTRAKIYDTRKTTPGWRRLEKYAVRQGGGQNHRMGLFDAILIKDNHLAFGATGASGERFTPAEAVRQARAFLSETFADQPASSGDPHAPMPLAQMIVEVEVDSLEQLREVLPEGPDIVLLDNMTPERLAQAVSIRDAIAANVQLEASGGVNLISVAAIAAAGVDRISVGALTHSAVVLDLGLDWR